MSCSDGAFPVCEPIPLTEQAERLLMTLETQTDFTPQRPCAARAGYQVQRVTRDQLPGGSPRLHFNVGWRGEPAFLFSQTRALVPFSQIPQGTHRLRVTSGAITADGFAGPSGSGREIAYLRWRSSEVTSELSATLHGWLTEGDIKELAAGLIAAGAADPAGGE